MIGDNIDSTTIKNMEITNKQKGEIGEINPLCGIRWLADAEHSPLPLSAASDIAPTWRLEGST